MIYYPQKLKKKRILIMELQRNFFIFAFLFVSFLLWQAWQSQLLSTNKNNETTNSSFHFNHEKNKRIK